MDNQLAVSAINKWSTAQLATIPYLTDLHSWALRTNTTISATYMDTLEHIRRQAFQGTTDHATRKDRGDCPRAWSQGHFQGSTLATTPQRAERPIQRLQGAPPHDRSGSTAMMDTLIPKGYLPIADSRARTTSTFCFPNLHQVQQTLITTLALLPLWPAAPWFNQAAHLACSMPTVLPPHAVKPKGQRQRSWPGWHWIGVELSGLKSRRM